MPDRESMPRWYPGDEIYADELNEIASGVERASRTSLGQGVASPSFSGTYLSDKEQFFCKIISRHSSLNYYAFREYIFDDDGLFVLREGGLSSYDRTDADPYAVPLYEVNDDFIPVDTYVWARPSENGAYFICQYADTRLTVSQAGTPISTQQNLNFISGTYVSATVADNAGASRVDVTLEAKHDLHVRVRKLVSFRGC